jgi:hypothetical protein
MRLGSEVSTIRVSGCDKNLTMWNDTDKRDTVPDLKTLLAFVGGVFLLLTVFQLPAIIKGLPLREERNNKAEKLKEQTLGLVLLVPSP